MRKQLAAIALSMLLFAGMGSATFLARALAPTNSSAAIRRVERIGPRPTPRWYWGWAVWRLGEGYAKGHALQRSFRPAHAPRRVPTWAWRRLHVFMQRRLAGTNAKRRHRSHTAPTITTPTTTPAPSSGWTNVIDDQFNSGGVPSHWILYHGAYGSSPHNCTAPSHDYVADGYLNLVESWEPATPAGASCPYGAGWYTGGMKLEPVSPYLANDQQVTVRYRIVSSGGVVSHNIIPMRWPGSNLAGHNNGEEDFLETDSLSSARTFLHYFSTSGSGQQVYSPLYSIDLTQWHTVRVTQLNHTISVYSDNLNTPTWTYNGDTTTVPDVLRTTVLQQECSHSNGCPSGTTGSEDIQIDWITVDNAS